MYLLEFVWPFSLAKDRKRTKMALKKAWKAFSNLLPVLLGVICLVGMMLALFDQELITRLIGAESGFLGVAISGFVGSITLIPGFVAFPTAKVLLDNGAGYTQIAAFVSTLMMVGVMTLPVEIDYFGKKIAVLRNLFSFLLSFTIAYVVGQVAGGVWF